MTDEQKLNARQLRAKQTKSEGLLWNLLRAKQVCALKFRRQHPIGPYFADFACVSKKLVIEIDGGYHDYTAEADLQREAFIRKQGWDVLRFNDEDVEEDAEVVARGIANHLGLQYDFELRKGSESGRFARRDIPSPQSRKQNCDPPQGG